MDIGFTGTQRGLTAEQKSSLWMVLRVITEIGIPVAPFHHGDCIGADQEAFELASMEGYVTHAHPCNIIGKRAWTHSRYVEKELPPLERNQVIVDRSDILIACPSGKGEILRSGTWATVRRAQKKGIPIIFVYPDGLIVWERL